MYSSIKLYFNNGGTHCYIVSVGNLERRYIKEDFLAGLDILDDFEEPTLYLFPDAVELSSEDLGSVQQYALLKSACSGDRFCILDVKMTDSKQDVEHFRTNIGNENLSFGAAYLPWLFIENGKAVPPSGAIAGIYCKNDDTKGVWKAPANVVLDKILGVTQDLTDEDQETLTIHEKGKCLNAIRYFAGRGNVVWGIRTLAGNHNDWRYISVKRLYLFIEKNLSKSLQLFVLEPNVEKTWTNVKSMTQNYLTDLWRHGALAGSKPEHALFIACGLNQTMMQQDIESGKLILQIGLAPLQPAEFIIFRISLQLRIS